MGINEILNPKSVVHIGASPDSQTTRRLLRSTAEVFLVNPNQRTMFGRDTFRTLAELSSPVDLALVNRPASALAGVLNELECYPLKAAVLYAAHVSAADKIRIAEVAQATGIRFLGPNSAGYVSAAARIDATSGGQSALFDPSGVSVVSQSGATCTEIVMALSRVGIGVRDVLSTGDEVDVTLEELLLEIVHGDPKPKIVILFAEQFRRPGQLVAGLQECLRLGIPVGVVKIGKTAAAAEAAQTHTGAIVGDWDSFVAMARRYGAIVCSTVEDLTELAIAAMSIQPAKVGYSPGIITNSGGAGGLSSDLMDGTSLVLADLSKATKDALSSQIVVEHVTWNPLDTSNTLGLSALLHNYLPAAESDPGIDEVVIEVQGGIPYVPEAEAAGVMSSAISKPFILCWPGLQIEHKRTLLSRGVAVFDEPAKMWRTLAGLADWSDHFRRVQRQGDEALQAIDKQPSHWSGPISSENSAFLTYLDARRLLAEVGIRQPAFVVADSEADLTQVDSQHLRRPLVVKISSQEAIHKSDIGGVQLGIITDAELLTAYQRIKELVGVQGVVVVEEQLDKGIELLVTARRTEYGRALYVGWGGTDAEAIRDVVTLIEPRSEVDILEGLRRTKVWATYEHPRSPRSLAPESQVCEFLLRTLEAMIQRPDIHEIEINPAIINEEGIFAADARVSTSSVSSRT